jgi:hypothetical protein
MEDTMRDLLSKLDALISETALNPADPEGDYEAKKKALQDLQMDPIAGEDPEISAAIIQRKSDLEKEAKSKGIIEDSVEDLVYQIGDDFGISFSEDFEIGTEIADILEDGIVVELDDTALEYLAQHGFSFEEVQIDEAKKKGLDGKACWKGYRYAGTKMKGGRRVDNCVKVSEEDDVEESGLQYYTGKKKYGKDGMAALAAAGREGASEEELGRIKDKYKKEDTDIDEAEYQGREVPLGKPMKGDVKKSKVYVKNPKGNVVKVNFGDKKMRIKKSNPSRRKSFRARHNCANPGPRHKARYWSCRAW